MDTDPLIIHEKNQKPSYSAVHLQKETQPSDSYDEIITSRAIAVYEGSLEHLDKLTLLNKNYLPLRQFSAIKTADELMTLYEYLRHEAINVDSKSDAKEQLLSAAELIRAVADIQAANCMGVLNRQHAKQLNAALNNFIMNFSLYIKKN